MNAKRTPQLSVALAAALALGAAGCAVEDKPRLYQAHELPPSGLRTDVPPSLYLEADPGAKVEVSAEGIEALRFLGPSLMEDQAGQFRGVNFAVYSQRAEKMRLLLFDDPEASRPTRQFDMTRVGDVWNVYVEGVGLGQHYGYVAWGPNWTFDEEWFPGSIKGYRSDVDFAGNRFNPNKLLSDPYCKAFNRDHDWSKGNAGTGPYRVQSNYAAAMKCVVVKSNYQWSEAEKAWRENRKRDDFEGHRQNDLVIYEVHAKGFTANSASGVKHYGTFRGFGEKADYFKELGITAVEMLPPFEKPLDGGYWGYNNLNYFAPELSYASRREQAEVIDEFKWMVDELHKRGIEVILDVVYNHTGEGGLWREKIYANTGSNPWNLDPEETASLFSFRGLDNWSYYALRPDNMREYCDYASVGNYARCNSAPWKRLIIDSLRYWVEEMHVDGYRFDLAPALGAKDGQFANCPTSRVKEGTSGIQWDPKTTIVQEIIDDPVLQRNNTRIIAEPWGGGGYPVGGFTAAKNKPGYAWGEWNDHFRDWVRSFMNYDDWGISNKSNGGQALTGTSERYGDDGRRPYHSVNFVTCHDGMTMYDVVSYDQKVNDCSPLNPICCTSPLSPFCDEAKRSGTDDNRSRNWSSAGEDFKRQLMRNFFAFMMFSHGTPMIFGGDEWLRTQLGNNNTYTPEADNPYSWHDWGAWQSKDERWRMFDFVKELIRFRKEHSYALAPTAYDKGAPFAWKSPENGELDWNGKAMMIHYHDRSKGPELAILINKDADREFTLPTGRSWKAVVDTQLYFDQPGYLSEKKLPHRKSANAFLDRPVPIADGKYTVKSRSIVILEAK